MKSLCGLYDLSDLVRLCLSLEILDVDPGIALPGCFEDVMAAFYSRLSEECSAYKLQLRKADVTAGARYFSELNQCRKWCHYWH